MTKPSLPNSVMTLRQQRLAVANKPFNARGATVVRCQRCQIALAHCCCHWARPGQSPMRFLLLMHHKEPLKPTNTGRLIAEILPDTLAYCWARTEPDPELLAWLKHSDYQPMIVFPGHYAEPERVHNGVINEGGKTPLLILLDGTWKQARRMFVSEYLAGLPVMSIDPAAVSRYGLRSAAHEHQLATAEVASQVLAVGGDQRNAQVLDAYFQVFSQRYQAGKRQLPVSAEGEPFRYLEELD